MSCAYASDMVFFVELFENQWSYIRCKT